MTIAEIIQPGDKVDISFVQNVERAKKGPVHAENLQKPGAGFKGERQS